MSARSCWMQRVAEVGGHRPALRRRCAHTLRRSKPLKVIAPMLSHIQTYPASPLHLLPPHSSGPY